jgi:CheY-like chemotaxis protein
MGHRGCVLVVDDDEAIRETVSELLRDEGYDVLCAENGAQALDLVRANATTLRVILLDLMMPVLSGWEFLEEAQEDPAFPKIPIVVVSAMAAPGVAGHIQKPLDLSILLGVVSRYCTHRPSAASPP